MFIQFFRRIYASFAAAFMRRITGAPTIYLIDVQMKDVNVTKDGITHCHLQLGGSPRNAVNAGIRIGVVTSAPRKPGQIEFVQVVKTHHTRIPGPNGNDQILTTNGAWMLDKQDPYAGQIIPNMMPGVPQGYDKTVHDTPGQNCVYVNIANAASGAFERVSVNEDFRMFVMWRPVRFGGRRRFPLAHVSWHWDGIATNVTDNEHCKCIAVDSTGDEQKWKLDSPAGNKNYSVRNPDVLTKPRWRGNVDNLVWVDVP